MPSREGREASEAWLAQKRAEMLELRDRMVPRGQARVILAVAKKGRNDRTVLNLGTDEEVVADIARLIIDRQLAIIDWRIGRIGT